MLAASVQIHSVAKRWLATVATRYPRPSCLWPWGRASLGDYVLDANVAHYLSREQVLSTKSPASLRPGGKWGKISRPWNLRRGLLRAKQIRCRGCETNQRSHLYNKDKGVSFILPGRFCYRHSGRLTGNYGWLSDRILLLLAYLKVYSNILL